MDTENFETIDEYYIERENKNADFYDCLKWLLIAVVLIACYHLVLYAAGYEVTSKYKSMALAQQSSEPADFIIGPCELQEKLNQIEPDIFQSVRNADIHKGEIMRIGLGRRVKDSITGYEGVTVARTSWLYGCERITIQGDLDKNGKIPDTVTIDEEQLIVVESKKKPNGHFGTEQPAGSRENPTRHPDPKY